ncbi:MAG: hypothetical protein ACPLPW_08550, partial [bacterium]
AAALQRVVSTKKKPVIFKGEQYLEFEDWQTLGRFYGYTTLVEWTRPVEFGEARGFEARAIAVDKYGNTASAAEAMCLNDEPNWKDKPLFQLRSMAQTRACAKALRNILAWVVILAGYRPTPAEEIEAMEDAEPDRMAPTSPKQETKPDESIFITPKQISAIHAIAGKLKVDLESFYKENHLPTKTNQLTKDQASWVIEKLRALENAAPA